MYDPTMYDPTADPSNDPDGDDLVIHTMGGEFHQAVCVKPAANKLLSIFYFSTVVLIAGFIVMSLFIGVISARPERPKLDFMHKCST